LVYWRASLEQVHSKVMSRKPKLPLRKGWTTGACAAAAALAAFEALETGVFPDPVSIRLPKGERPLFELACMDLVDGAATAGIVKDAGDDPDVTHGVTVLATIRRNVPGTGIIFHAGDGVGTVTKPGLPVVSGEPAINPGPRKMIGDALLDSAEALDVTADLDVTIAIPGGEEIAKKTWNPRLGIVGGLSILGTTGIVHPYSCSAWIHSIHQGIDVARATGVDHVAGVTGRTSEAAIGKMYGFDEGALIDMGDFVGGMLKYLRRHPIERLTVGGGFAKMVKLAQGNLDLHSSRSQVDFKQLAQWLADLGAEPDDVARAEQANTAAQILMSAGSIEIGGLVARRAREVALATLSGRTAVEIVIVDRNGTVVGRADG
jgi:cobalt-precorrin-5B (C1)-methyltransferase